MPKVSVKVFEVPVPATSHPEIKVYFDGDGSGVTSQISWTNEAVMQGLRVMFAVRGDEAIDTITINEQGIKATFKMKNLHG